MGMRVPEWYSTENGWSEEFLFGEEGRGNGKLFPIRVGGNKLLSFLGESLPLLDLNKILDHLESKNQFITKYILASKNKSTNHIWKRTCV